MADEHAQSDSEEVSPGEKMLVTEIDMLRKENVRLREEKASRITAKRVMGLLLLLSAIALGGAAAFPTTRDVFIALAGTGIFGAILLLLLTNERLVTVSVTRALTTALGGNNATLLAELDADGTPQYVPAELNSVGVKLFCPRDDTIGPATESELDSVIVARGNEYHGLSLDPSGRNLFLEFEALVTESMDDPEVALQAMREAITDQFELADTVDIDSIEYTAADELREVTLRVEGCVIGPIDQRDHPIQSLISIGLVRVLDRPVSASFAETDGGTVLTFSCLTPEPSTDSGEDTTSAVSPADD